MMNSGNKYLIAFTTMLGTFMEIVDTSVANVALPHMAGTYGAGTDEITWVITSYLVANAVILPLTGWIGNFFGRKRAYLACLVIFTLASLGSGAAPTLPILILMRVVQGLAGGAMVPMSQAIMLETFPKEEHGKAMALFGVGVIFGPIIGPTLGGWITDNWNWPWIFYVNIPVGIVAIVLGYMLIEDPHYIKKPEGRVDYWSFAFVALGLGSLEVLLNRGERYDWFESGFIRFWAVAAAVGIFLFIWRSFTAENPLVNLSIMKNKEYAAGTSLMFLTGFGLYGSFVMLPIFCQHLLGYTPTLAGLVISPGGFASLIAMVFVGTLVGRIDTRILVFTGIIFNIVSLWLLTFSSLSSDFAFLMASRLFQGFGLGFLFVPITVSAFTRIPPHLTGQATGLFNLLRNEGASVGIALSATVLSQRSQFHHNNLVSNLTPFSGELSEALGAAGHYFFGAGGLDPASSKLAGMGLVYRELVRQSYLMAFVDVFHFLMIVFFLLIPFVFLLKGRAGKAAAQTPQ
ncbi:MAG TPA: DHA2 family efflux MFS transporter permease subunit [Acidobacteriota bacterium]|nr:DHA2 family efflux MFS transporter permease subunit [Acidobacteriota bacterium]